MRMTDGAANLMFGDFSPENTLAISEMTRGGPPPRAPHRRPSMPRTVSEELWSEYRGPGLVTSALRRSCRKLSITLRTPSFRFSRSAAHC